MGRGIGFCGIVAFACLALTACSNQPLNEQTMRVHYVEIVTKDVAQTCSALEQIHGLEFGEMVADLGNARVAKVANGTLIGIRAPLAEHETPIVRTYFAVDDISETVKAAEAAGGFIAYPPTQHGDTGTGAIYILDGIQYGLWQGK